MKSSLARSCQEESGCGLLVVTPEAEDEAKAFRHLGGFQMASEVKCKLVLIKVRMISISLVFWYLIDFRLFL